MAPTAEATGEATRARSLLRTSGALLASSRLRMASSFLGPLPSAGAGPDHRDPHCMLHTWKTPWSEVKTGETELRGQGC